ncbi:MAG: hypothetical protein CVV47_07190 [Spirochaetae bacterium HGW-Spirochaetae-3]|jgi:sugar phosphate isomerase/epimerase|nr:MAG: hypothetical protein CVV47_07190 [Spirochaetae bacterium HGW-Spirochaetae-3]
MIHTALSSSACIGADIHTVLETASAAGVHGVEWTDDGFVSPGDVSAARETMMATLRAGLCTVSYATLYRAVSHDRSAFRAALATTREFNAPILRLWSSHRGDSPAADAAAFLDEIRYLGDEAGEQGVMLCLGLSHRSILDSSRTATGIMAGMDHPFVKLIWEPGSGELFDDAMEDFTLLSGRIGLVVARGEDVAPFNGGDASSGALDGRAEAWLQYLDSFDEQCGDPDMARYVVIKSIVGGTSRLSDSVSTIKAWSAKLRRYHRRRVM